MQTKEIPSPDSSSKSGPRLTDPLLVLFGNKQAILRLATSPHTLLIGAILVITAGLARNHDHHHLLTEWKWLFGPYLASLFTSVIIYIFGCFRHFNTKSVPYLTFLSLYWMTSPCAWLYALPIESITDIVTATRWNIAFLAIVSIWRVLLVSRFLSVVSGEKFIRSFISIVWPASAIMCIASFFKGLELVGIMGGIELSEHEVILHSAASFTTVVCFFITILAFITHISLWLSGQKKQSTLKPFTTLPFSKSIIPKPLFIMVSLILAASLFIISLLPFQPQTKNNYTLYQLIENKKHPEAVTYASALTRKDFLEHHEFPPGKGGYYKVLPILASTSAGTPRWIIEEWFLYVEPGQWPVYEEQFLQELAEHFPQNLTPHQKAIQDRIIDKLLPPFQSDTDSESVIH